MIDLPNEDADGVAFAVVAVLHGDHVHRMLGKVRGRSDSGRWGERSGNWAKEDSREWRRFG